uniref:C1q domain-containing protein n=1 Tax=Sander lucioperca TaxID=283035 RepID=A0A8C9XAK0_SANLU
MFGLIGFYLDRYTAYVINADGNVTCRINNELRLSFRSFYGCNPPQNKEEEVVVNFRPVFPLCLHTWRVSTKTDVSGRTRRLRQVAFSASLVVAGESRIGHFSSETPLTFKYVPTNIGNAYNSTTGQFTAPVRGVYHFEWHFNGIEFHSAGWLVKNSEKVFAVYEHQTAGWMSASNGVTLLLEVGDVVSVRLAANSMVFDNFNHHTTFSGHLLFPM